MKVAICQKIKEGPWGGGNSFVKSLSSKLKDQGHNVFYDLSRDDLDIILLTDPRKSNSCVTFGVSKIINYLIKKNSQAIVVHRINECDERKKTLNMNRMLRFSNYCADHTVFIASWLKDLKIYEIGKPSSVILNGGNKELFIANKNVEWDFKSPLKIVTHHWGGNYMKGFDVYEKLDKYLSDINFRKKINFTYIGNLPKNFNFLNTNHINPLSGEELATELSKHHVYLTASVNEPAGMHHIEGALSGLPLIFRKSGALPEYCSDYGIEFIDDDFLPALEKMRYEYTQVKKKLSTYPHTSDKMACEYINLFKKILENKDNYLKKRHLFRNPLKLVLNMLFM